MREIQSPTADPVWGGLEGHCVCDLRNSAFLEKYWPILPLFLGTFTWLVTLEGENRVRHSWNILYERTYEYICNVGEDHTSNYLNMFFLRGKKTQTSIRMSLYPNILTQQTIVSKYYYRVNFLVP